MPNQPEQSDLKSLGLTTIHNGTKSLLAVAGSVPTGPFQARTVAYPSQDGAALGIGWDFLTNTKKSASCVNATSATDKHYQTADTSVQQTFDEETLDFTLNATFSGNVAGDIGVVSAKADSTMSVNASHHLDTTDTNFVAHGSITSGVDYLGPQNGQISLTSDAIQSLSDPVAFRAKCGDGFVATIGYGADLYVLFHAHDLTQEDKLSLTSNIKASAGEGNVFNAGGSSNLSTTLDKLSKSSQLDVSFVQNGGIITSIPTTLVDAQSAIKNLAEEEINNNIEKGDGPRAIYMRLIPYSDLPNWPGFYMIDTTDARQKAIRYGQRLVSALYEVMNIRENYYRERADLTVSDLYFYRYAHNLRDEDLGVIQSKISNMIITVNALIDRLNQDDCNSKPVSPRLLTPRSATAKYIAQLKVERALSLKSFASDAAKCAADVQYLITATGNFDDFQFWIMLPIPIDAIAKSAAHFIEDPGNDRKKREDLFAQNIYRHWVDEPDQIRCRLFFECLTSDAKAHVYADIVSSISKQPASFATIPLVDCAGENADSCPSGSIHFDCDHVDQEGDATEICENQRKAFRHTFTRTAAYNGNRCGYWVDDVTCYVGTNPQFP